MGKVQKVWIFLGEQEQKAGQRNNASIAKEEQQGERNKPKGNHVCYFVPTKKKQTKKQKNKTKQKQNQKQT